MRGNELESGMMEQEIQEAQQETDEQGKAKERVVTGVW